MGKRLLEGATQQQRAANRKTLGPLRKLTVQPSTRNRYDAAIDHFLRFLKENSLSLPSRRDLLDPMVCDFLEHLWSSGFGRALASDCVAGLQDQDPKLRSHLPGSWRLLKAWAVNEIPNRAPPLPEHILHAMCGWACFHQQYGFAVSLLVGFYGMLRTGELLGLRRKDFMAEPGSRKVLISLGLTKAGKRVGAAESVILGHDVVVPSVLRWMALTSSSQTLTPSPPKWRALFNDSLKALKVDSLGFRPYSLRRGGATWWYSKHHSLDKLLVDGRWQAAKTAGIYLNDGLSMLASIKIPRTSPTVSPFLSIFRSKMFSPVFATLEPPVGRSGGRGSKAKASKSGRRSRKN